ncbi:MAG: glycoside hydrolase family 5 protein [Oscillospiraceae bacterium]|jgi:endoglucanase|nr:glycoside hydrolase family 5 protein [Oscillospiraceae bacterium]
MKIAKVTALLLCFALLGGLMAACGEDTPEVSGEESYENGKDIEDGEEEKTENDADVDNAMEFRDLTAAQLLSEMGAGWNLGNTLDARGQANGTPEQQERAWGNPTTTPEMIQLLVDTGFRTLRVPVTWQVWIGEAPDFIINEAWMDRVQEVVDYGIDSGLYVILNLHHERWHFPSEDNYETAKAQLIAVWAQIAERFGGYSERLIFEGMNEPRMTGTDYEWRGGTEEAREVINKWNEAFVETVRASGGNNERRWLMVTTHAAASFEPQITDFRMPEGENIAVSIHQYLPHGFALNPRSSNDEFDRDNTAHTRDIDSMFERLYDRFVSQGIPVIIGEMGSINKNNLEARVNATRHYTELAASHGIPCLWWDNGINERNPDRRDEEAFGIMDRRNLEWWHPEIAQAMVDAFN